MASKTPIWGIDVGQRLLKAVKLQQAGDQVELLAFDLIDLDTVLGAEAGEADVNAAAVKALQVFAGRNNLKDSRIVVAVPGQQTLTRFTKMPPVEQKKIPDMVKYEASQQIPFDIDEVVWDYQVFSEKESPDIEVGIFAIRKELIRNYLTRFTDQGLEPIIVQTSPMASYNAAKFELGDLLSGESKQAFVLLDMGALATDLIVMEGNRIWSRPVPIGGNRFTDALVSAFKLSFKKAEKVKRTTTVTSSHARQVFQAMRPVFADLVSEVQRSIGFYTSTHREAHITRVIGMGNAFKLPGLQKFLQQNLQIEVERFAGFKRAASAGADKSPEFVDNILSFPVAYGLALQGLGLAGVTSNLLPLEVHRSLLWQKKRAWFAASTACLLVAGGALPLGNMMANRQIASAMGNLNTIAVQRAPTTQAAEQVIASTGADAPPLEKGARVAGAAEFFQSALNAVERLRKGDQASLKTMAKLPENNTIVPRMVEVVQKAFAGANDPRVQKIESLPDYIEFAQATPRPEREEVWLEGYRLLYHPQDPAQVFGGTTGRNLRSRPGWAIQVTGLTTLAEPAKLIDERIINEVLKLGRAPGLGFYIDTATLSKIGPRASAPAKQERDAFEEPPPTGGTRGRPGAGGRGGRPPGGVGDGGGPRGRPPARPDGPRLDFGGGGGTSVSDDSGGLSLNDELIKWREKLRSIDPATGETTSTDQRFELQIVVRKGDTPANLIPEEYKPKKDQPPTPGGEKR